MVRTALYACGAADALMNRALPETIRRNYEHAYDLLHDHASGLIAGSKESFRFEMARGSDPDALPLYYATFLLHAAAACVKGTRHLSKAMRELAFLDQHTALFPLTIRVVRNAGNDWEVFMLVSSRIRYPSIPLIHCIFPSVRTLGVKHSITYSFVACQSCGSGYEDWPVFL